MMDFMDSLRRGVDRAGYEVDRLLRANRVRSQIGALRRQKDEEVRWIGQQLVDMHLRGEPIPESLVSRVEQVKQYDSEIAEKEAELEAINQEAPAASEQETSTPEPGAFTVPTTEARRCPNCGAAVSESASFCPNCGTDLRARPQTPPAPEEPVSSSIPEEPEPPAPGAMGETRST